MFATRVVACHPVSLDPIDRAAAEEDTEGKETPEEAPGEMGNRTPPVSRSQRITLIEILEAAQDLKQAVVQITKYTSKKTYRVGANRLPQPVYVAASGFR